MTADPVRRLHEDAVAASPARSVADLYDLTPVVPLTEAAIFYGIGRSAAYEMAKAGGFPVETLRLGRRVVVTRAALIRHLDPDGTGRPR